MICAVRARTRSIRSASLRGLRPRPGPLNNNSPARSERWCFAGRLRSRMNRLCLNSARANMSSNEEDNSCASGPLICRPRSRQPRVTPSPCHSGAMLKPPMNASFSSQISSLRWLRMLKRRRVRGLNQRISPPAFRKGPQKLSDRVIEPNESMSTCTRTPRREARISASRNRSPRGLAV